MDTKTQDIIDCIINDVRRSSAEGKENVGYIDWDAHLEEVGSFGQYPRAQMGAAEVYHEAMKPYYWDYLTGKINWATTNGNLMVFLMNSFRLFDGAAEWIAKKGILTFVDNCLDNDCDCSHFQHCLLVFIKLGYRRFIHDWPIDEINEYLEHLEVAPDHRRGEYFCALSAFYLIDKADVGRYAKDEMLQKLNGNWRYLLNIYSVMVRSIVGSLLNNYAAIINTVKISGSCHHHIYLFYDALNLRLDFLKSKYDGLSPAKKKEALQKFDKHLADIQDIMKNTKQEDDLEQLCSIIFGSELEAALNRKRFMSYKELEAEAAYWKQRKNMSNIINYYEPGCCVFKEGSSQNGNVTILVTNEKDNTDTCTTDEIPVTNDTELFRYIHPGVVENGERLKVHKQVQNLLTHFGIQDICAHLKQMHDDRLVLLPVKGAQEMFFELQRMGMPDKEGFALKTFEKYYQR